MTAIATEIVTQYEQLGLTPTQIVEASEGNYDLTAVKATLMQYSAAYRKDVKSGEVLAKEDDFSEQDLKESNEAIRSILLSTEDEYLRFRAAKYIRDDKKGRLDAVKNFNGLNINYTLIQQAILAGRASLDATREKCKTINVASESKT